jgi:hypothetical protein
VNPYKQLTCAKAQAGVAATTLVTPVTTAASAGNTVIGVIKTSSSFTVTSVTDTAGNTWTVDQVSTNTASQGNIVRSRLTVNLTTSDSITANFASHTGQFSIFVEYSGSWVLDKHRSNQSATSALTGASGASAALATAPQLVVSGLAVSGSQGAGAYTVPSGFTERPHGLTVNNFACLADNAVADTAAQNVTWTWPTSANWAIVLATYSPAPIPGSTQTLMGIGG